MKFSDARCTIHDARFYIQDHKTTTAAPSGWMLRPWSFYGDLRGDVMRSAPRRLLRFKGYIVGARMHELEFESTRQSLVKCVRSLEAA